MTKLDESFYLTVRNREQIVYHGWVKSLSSHNDKGVFDILSLHANFITLVEKALQISDTEGNQIEIPVGNGILRVLKNNVQVYLGVKR